MPSEKEMKALTKTIAYEIRLFLQDEGKETYTQEELEKLLDKFVRIKDQEP